MIFTSCAKTVEDEEVAYVKEPSSRLQEVSVNEEESNSDEFAANTPYEKHGALSVKGTDLVDKNGEKFMLYGMSTHGIAWFPQYISKETFSTLHDDWNTNCVRIALYTYESGGYCTDGNRENLKQLVKNGVDIASELGIYVIIDWHILNEHNPLTYKSEAVEFFKEISAACSDRDNILYEICNEPNSGCSWEDVKTYANEVIPVIRANDKNAVILVGTPTWSQDIDKALESPLEFENIMYTLHFYAATHTDWLRDRLKVCHNAGLPVFVSEFGICDASGNGNVDLNQAEQWKALIEQYDLSHMCWNLANNNESSSVILPSCQKLSDFTADDLSEQGKWIYDWYKSETAK